MIEHIFVDMDGVLVDFVGQACRVFHKTFEEVKPLWPAGSWDYTAPLGVSKNEFWRTIDAAGCDHWSSMAPYPWATSLWQSCRRIAPSTVLSSPSNDPTSLAGKLQWLQQHLGGRAFRDFLIGPRKEACARPGAVLIDDSDKNCEKFVAAGGSAIVFPRWWNSQHAEAENPIAYVHARLAELAEVRAATKFCSEG